MEISRDAPRWYCEFPLPKQHGGFRTIEAPHARLKKLQQKLLDKFLNKLQVHPQLFGAPGTSAKKSVANHVKKPMVVTIDIADFFPSVRVSAITAMFQGRGASSRAAEMLTRLVSHKRHLPQGAPTSPCIGRLALCRFAHELETLLRSVDHRCAFSIYVDDITLSGPNGIERLPNTIYRMLQRHGFKPNIAKTQVMSSDGEQESLNIRLNRRIEATTQFLREIEEIAKKVPPNNPSLRGKRGYVHYLRK
jgi:RNA-directed DNA polymerase